MISNILLSSLSTQRYAILLLPEVTKLHVLQSMISSVICYCFPPYSNSNLYMESIKKLQVTVSYTDSAYLVQRPCVHFSESCEYATEGGSLQSRVMPLGLLHLTTRRAAVPFVQVHGEVELCSNRLDGQLHIPRVRHEVGRKGFSHFRPTLNNGILCNLSH